MRVQCVRVRKNPRVVIARAWPNTGPRLTCIRVFFSNSVFTVENLPDDAVTAKRTSKLPKQILFYRRNCFEHYIELFFQKSANFTKPIKEINLRRHLDPEHEYRPR